MACALASLKFFRCQAIREHPVLQHRTFATLQKIRKLGSEVPISAICAKGCFAEAASRRLQAGRTSA